MSGRFCRMTNCFAYEVGDTQRCEEHLPEELKGATVVEPENGPYEGDKFTIYAGKVHEIKAKDRTAWSLTRYDIDPEYYIVPLINGRLSVPSIVEVQKYLKEREAYMHRMMEPAPEPDPEASVGSFEGQLGQVLAEMEELLLKKNKDYGSSYDKTVEELGETVILIRIMDKFNRLKQLIKSGEPGEVEETIEETLSDLVGYGIIELVRRRRS